MVIGVVSSLLLVCILYINVGNYMADKTYETAQKSSFQAVTQIEHELTVIENLLFSAINNESIIGNLKTIEDPTVIGMNKLDAATELEEALFLLSNESNLIDSLLLLTNDNQYSSSNTVVDFSFNQLQLKFTSQANNLLNQDEYLKNVTAEVLNQEEIESISEPRLDGRLFFASNVIADGIHMGQLWILVDNEALTSNLLNGSQYSITYKGHMVDTGAEEKSISDLESNKVELNLRQNQSYVIVNDILPYDLSVYFRTRRFENVDLSILLLTLILVMFVLFIITFWLSKLISKQVLKPVTELLQWMNQQKQDEGAFDFKRKTQSLTFRTRLIGYFILTIFLPLLTSTLIFYSLSYSVVTEEVIKLNSSDHHSKTIQINNELNKIMKVIASYSVNLNISPNIEEVSVKGLYNYLDSNSTLSKVEFLAFYNPVGKAVYTSNQNTPERINLEGMNQSNSKSRIYFYKYPIEEGVLITIVLPERMTKFLPESFNMIAVKIGSNYFSSLPSISDAKAEYIHQNNELYWNIGQELLLDKDTKNTYTLSSALGTNELTFISKYDLSVIQKDINQLFLSQSYWLVILMLIIIIISMSLTSRIMKPFSKIINMFQDKEDYFPEKELSHIDEIHELQLNFENSVSQLNKLMKERVENQKTALKIEYDRREIQLFAMQNQVNPHFLYNSLDNLLFLVESNEEDRATMMISSLSHFFRYLTDRRHSIIKVHQEVDFTQRYIDIMTVRFENFRVIWDIKSSSINKNIMKLTLQPIVENSIQHGAAHSDKLVTIKVIISEINEGLFIQVIDDGLGISEDKLIYINNEIKHSSYNKSGLFNVRDRLELYYGESIEIAIESQLGEGTKVKIWIPYEIQ